MESPAIQKDGKSPNLKASFMRGLRTELGFSETQVANSIGIAVALYRRFENNSSSPSQLTMEKLKAFFEENLSRNRSEVAEIKQRP